MARDTHHSKPPIWVLGTTVLITFTDGQTAEGVLVEQQRVIGTQGGRPIKQTDRGPFHYPHVRYVSPYTGKTEDRPFPEHQITVLTVPNPSESEGDAA